MTRNVSPTANDNTALGAAGRREPDFGTMPRSPVEALEPSRVPEPPEREPPPRGMHPVLRFFNGLLTLFFVVALVLVSVLYFFKVQFDRPGPLATSTVIVVPRGEPTSSIAERLEREGIIADRRIFVISAYYFAHLKGKASLKAGEYEFGKAASMRQVLDTLVEGKSIEHKITLPEGLTSRQIVVRLRAHPELHGEITDIPAEGSLLPDTYRFARNDSRQDIIDRMRVAQEKFLANLWEERHPTIMVRTPEEALVLASIVEKETGRADERPRIAAVFHNRLKRRMRLQSDPTIIYGLVGGAGGLDHPIRQSELDRQTRYNTYQIDGLPPTPIANPGRAAIEAVLKPAKTEDLYFVADGTGGHAFAPSLHEHNKNVFRWRKIVRDIRAREAQEAAAAATAAAESASAEGIVVEPGVGSDPLPASSALLSDVPPTAAGAAPAGTPAAPIPVPRRNPNR